MGWAVAGEEEKMGQASKWTFYPFRTMRILHWWGLWVLCCRQFLANRVFYAQLSTRGPQDLGHKRAGKLSVGQPIYLKQCKNGRNIVFIPDGAQNAEL